MRESLRWLPGIGAGLVWLLLAQLAQPWLSRLGIQLYADPLLIVLPALFFPIRPALVTVLFCALVADATRPCPFGLSASLLLPSLLLLHAFQQKISRWPRRVWLPLALGLNLVLTPLFLLLCFFLVAPSASSQAVLVQIGVGGAVSSLWIALLGHWFFSFQLASLRLSGKDLVAENKNRP